MICVAVNFILTLFFCFQSNPAALIEECSCPGGTLNVTTPSMSSFVTFLPSNLLQSLSAPSLNRLDCHSVKLADKHVNVGCLCEGRQTAWPCLLYFFKKNVMLRIPSDVSTITMPWLWKMLLDLHWSLCHLSSALKNMVKIPVVVPGRRSPERWRLAQVPGWD